MYEFLLQNLISNEQVYGERVRSNNKGLMTFLNRNQFIELALKYFGVDKNGNFTSNTNEITGYSCPYSGEIITSNAAIEHLLPVSKHGGTVIFNCIPIVRRVNGEKYDKTIDEWWFNSRYFNYDRLERLINYILDAYLLDNKDLKEIPNIDDYTIECDSNEQVKANDESEEKIETNENSEVVNYYQLIDILLDKLSEDRDVSIYRERLNDLLYNKNVFGQISKIEKMIKIFQRILKEKYEVSLSFFVHINYYKLFDSLKTDDYEKELNNRIDYIDRILRENNKTFNSYAENIKDIEDVNILYLSEVSDMDKELFINSLKLGYATKLDLYIDMLSEKEYTGVIIDDRNKCIPDSNNILAVNNEVPFKGYEKTIGLSTKYFYSHNVYRINELIDSRIKSIYYSDNVTVSDLITLRKLEQARQAIKEYEFYNPSNANVRIDTFIDMLSNEKYTGYCIKNNRVTPNELNILAQDSNVPFEGFEGLGFTTQYFYGSNKDEIKERVNSRISDLKISLKNDPDEFKQEELRKLEKARKAIRDYDFSNVADASLRIDIFIDMMADKENTGIAFTDKNKMIPDNYNIFGTDNKICFKGYEEGIFSNITTSEFYMEHEPEIQKRLDELIEELKKSTNKEDKEKLERLEIAKEEKRKYDFYNNNNLIKRIDKFIDMLSNEIYTGIMIDPQNGRVVPDNNNILTHDNKIHYEGYDDLPIYTAQLYGQKRDMIINRIKERIEEITGKEELNSEDVINLEKLKKASKAIDDYEFYNTGNAELRINKFIDMIGKDKYTSYENGKPDKLNVFKTAHKPPKEKPVLFEGYEHLTLLNTDHFWSNSRYTEIIPRLFFDSRYSGKEYDKARKNVLIFLNYCRKKNTPEFKTIDDFIKTLDATKKNVKKLIEIRDRLLNELDNYNSKIEELKSKKGRKNGKQ